MEVDEKRISRWQEAEGSFANFPILNSILIKLNITHIRMDFVVPSQHLLLCQSSSGIQLKYILTKVLDQEPEDGFLDNFGAIILHHSTFFIESVLYEKRRTMNYLKGAT